MPGFFRGIQREIANLKLPEKILKEIFRKIQRFKGEKKCREGSKYGGRRI